MTIDDDADCVEHVWSLTGATFALDGAHLDYECDRCGAVTLVGPGERSGEWDRQDAVRASRSDTDAGA